MTDVRSEPDPLVALCAGDPAPFETFVHAWTRNLTAFFCQQGAPLSRAEDLTQETFLKLYRGAGRYRPRERFTAFCFRTARNVWIDECRRAAARIEGVPRETPHPVEGVGVHVDPGAGLLFAEEERDLRALLVALPPGQRRVLELALLAELSYAEIAALLAIPVGTVKSRMFHALRRLRGVWEERRLRVAVAGRRSPTSDRSTRRPVSRCGRRRGASSARSPAPGPSASGSSWSTSSPRRRARASRPRAGACSGSRSRPRQQRSWPGATSRCGRACPCILRRRKRSRSLGPSRLPHPPRPCGRRPSRTCSRSRAPSSRRRPRARRGRGRRR